MKIQVDKAVVELMLKFINQMDRYDHDINFLTPGECHDLDELRNSVIESLAEPAVEPFTSAIEVLKALEWQELRHEYRESEYFCPVCDRDKRQGHEAGCALAVALAELAVEPRNHVGNSKFESWYSEYNASGKGDKQRARDAYAAGIGDFVYPPSPPPQAEVPLNQCDWQHEAIVKLREALIRQLWYTGQLEFIVYGESEQNCVHETIAQSARALTDTAQFDYLSQPARTEGLK